MKISLLALIAGFCLVVGLPLAATAGPASSADGADADLVGQGFDNCTQANNPDQKDYDHDGCGDACDCDLNNDGVSGGAADQSIMNICLFVPGPAMSAGPGGIPPATSNWNPVCDLAGAENPAHPGAPHDGIIGAPDRAICKPIEAFIDLPLFTPGPSGIPAVNKTGIVPPNSLPLCP